MTDYRQTVKNTPITPDNVINTMIIAGGEMLNLFTVRFACLKKFFIEEIRDGNFKDDVDIPLRYYMDDIQGVFRNHTEEYYTNRIVHLQSFKTILTELDHRYFSEATYNKLKKTEQVIRDTIKAGVKSKKVAESIVYLCKDYKYSEVEYEDQIIGYLPKVEDILKKD